MNLRFYARLFFRRLPAMMALFILCSGIGLAMAMRLPTTYQTSARLLVEGPQIPDNMASSTVQTDANQEIEILRQQLMTRANLIEIADKLRVFPNRSQMSPDDIVSQMRKATRISSSGGSRRGNIQPTLVTISFEARSGQIAANVVNEYVTRLTNANVELRTGRAVDTLDFFKQEVDRLSSELDRSSAKIAEFQNAHANALPEDLAFRQSRQAQLQERVSGATRERSALADQRRRMIEVYQSTGQVAATQNTPLTPEQKQLHDLQSQYETARTIYSETSPRVVMLKAQIDQLAARIGASEPAPAPTTDGADKTPPGTTPLDLQLAQVDSQIAGLDSQVSEAEAELKTLSASIAATPANAIVLQSLQRDYENIRQQYDRAVQRLAQASVGERIELTSRGQRITLLEAANVPSSPASPNRPKIAAVGAGVGLGLAGGLFALLEFLNRSVRIPSDLTRGFGIMPLVTIPYFESARRRMIRRSLRVAILLVVLAGVPAALWAIDTYYLPLDLLAQRLLERIGLS